MTMLSLEPVPKASRTRRAPRHTFNVIHKPFAIQPFVIAPVLPGETMENALLQARVVTDPIKNKLIGWHQEYYLFYCKLTDLDGREDYKSMMLDPDFSMAAQLAAASNVKHYTYDDNASMDYVRQCLKRVTEEYFREEGEAWDVTTIDGLPAAKITNTHWMDSAILSANLPSGDDIDTADVVQPDDISKAYRTWQLLMAQSLINMTYEDYLRSFGIKGAAVMEGSHIPELIRVVSDWSYPANTVVPTTGAVTSAVSWTVSERADKKRFFTQPGFIFGVTVTRPKIYLSNQRGPLSNWLNRAQDWLPAILREDPWTSLKEFSGTTGPLAGFVGGGDHWIDLRDLFVHGDQFVNTDITTGDGADNDIELPGATLTHAAKFYPSEAMADSLFAADTAEYVRQDGVISFNIQGTQRDNT